MFTTLTIKKSRRFFRKISSEICEYKGFTYYSSTLLSKKKNNQKYISRFKKRVGIPIIEENDDIVLRYKMIVLANSVMSRPYKKVGIYDTEGYLPFLVPFISKNCGVISVFTKNAAVYSDIENEIGVLYGTPIIINDNISDILRCDISFALTPPVALGNSNIFTLNDTEKKELSLPLPLPEAAGLFYYGGFSEFGKLTFKEAAITPPRL